MSSDTKPFVDIEVCHPDFEFATYIKNKLEKLDATIQELEKDKRRQKWKEFSLRFSLNVVENFKLVEINLKLKDKIKALEEKDTGHEINESLKRENIELKDKIKGLEERVEAIIENNVYLSNEYLKDKRELRDWAVKWDKKKKEGNAKCFSCKEEYKCAPFLLECGHSLCESCISKLKDVAKKEEECCPVCHRPIDFSKPFVKNHLWSEIYE
uniref:RING-type domain-containing protein n=1 Tax=Caenorhabditis tropicalis TaxID=1561998 RepID=A0A1I7T8V9_9PELO